MTSVLIQPPTKPYRRCGSWTLFERRFEPLPAPTHDYLWEIADVPVRPDCREWWTVLDCEGKLVAVAGFHFVNRFAFIRCGNLWSGDWSEHPEYLYA